MRKLLIGIGVVIIVLAIILGVWSFLNQPDILNQSEDSPKTCVFDGVLSDVVCPEFPTNFMECISSGFPAMESYPRKCKDDEGNYFTENIGNELEKMDLIRLDSPRPNSYIESPLVISGEARGAWFFEGDFPVVLTDWDGLIIAEGYATARGEWMTEEFVQFDATLDFISPTYKNNGTLILQKDNPSGLPENDDALEVPIFFKTLSTNMDLLLGKWVSVDDGQYTVEFKDGKKIDFYDGVETHQEEFDIFNEAKEKDDNGDILQTRGAFDASEYTIVELSHTDLQLTFLPRGNTLQFKRID